MPFGSPDWRPGRGGLLAAESGAELGKIRDGSNDAPTHRTVDIRRHLQAQLLGALVCPPALRERDEEPLVRRESVCRREIFSGGGELECLVRNAQPADVGDVLPECLVAVDVKP